MENPIHLRFSLKKDDFVQAARGLQINQGNNRFWGALLIVLVAVGVLGLLRNGIEPSILAFVILASFGLLYAHFVVPALGASRLAQDPNSTAENHWSISKSQIVFHSGDSAADLGWSFFGGFVETKSAFLLIHSNNKQVFQIFPKRAFASAGHESDFRQFLKDRFEKNRGSYIARNWRLILFVVLVLAANIYVGYILSQSR